MNKGKPKKFTLRKLSVGVVSLGAGVMLFGSASETVKADTVSNEETANTVTSPSILSSPVASTVSSVSSNEEETRTLTDGSSTATVAASPVNVSRESATPVVGETVEKTEVATPAAIRGLDASSSSIPSTTSTVNQNIQEVKNLYEAELTNKSKTVKDENGILTKKEQKELFEIKKEVIDVGNDELEVKTTIDFKDIDYGAEVIILLDTSSKMTEESFNEAEIKIQQIVDTLTGNVSNRNLNTVRLITFNKEVDNPIMLLDKGSLVDKQNKQLSVNHLKNKINEGKYQKADGVALQAAIHRARELFKNEKQGSKNYLKRQHIILFTQGEATYSYDLSEKFKKENSDKNLPYIKDTKNKKVDYTNPYSLLPYEASVAESSMLNDLKLLIKRLKSLGIDVSKVEEKIKTVDLTVGVALQGLSWIGVKPLDYLFLKEFDGLKMKEKDFNYNSKQVGEGKHFQSYYERRTLKGGEQIINTIAQNIKAEILKGKKSRDTIKNSTVVFDKLKGYSNSWLPFGVESVNEVIEWTKNKTKEGLEWTEQKYEDFLEASIKQLLTNIFYHRQYTFYNHNESAIAEALMAQEDDIKIFAVNIMDYKQNEKKLARSKRDVNKNNMFSDYLKNMTSNKNFLEELQDSKKLEENFKDLYSSIELTDVFESNIKYVKESASKNSNYSIKHTDAKSVLLSIFSSNGGKESVTLKMDKAQILKALEKGSVVFTYKIKVDTPAKFTTKSSKKSLNKSSKIVSSSLSYKINEKNGKKVNLGEVKLKGAMVTRPMPAPVPPVPPVVKPEQPSVPPTEGPTPPPVKPELPSKPDVPSLPTPQPVPPSEPGEPIAPGESDVPSAPEVPQEPEIPSEPQVPSEPEVHTNSQHIELEFNNQFPSISGNNSSILNSEGSDTTIEDTMPEKESHSDVHISGGNVIDIDMSTNPDMLGHHTDMSGDNSSIIKLYGQDKDGNIMEDTRPQVDIEIGGGQIIDIDISTSPDMIGHNTDMSGDNSDIIKLYGQDKDGTIIEDTLPEMPQESENPQVSETPKATDIFAKAPAHHTPALPATGDDNVSNFTAMLVGLGLISTAGWYGKKKRQEKN